MAKATPRKSAKDAGEAAKKKPAAKKPSTTAAATTKKAAVARKPAVAKKPAAVKKPAVKKVVAKKPAAKKLTVEKPAVEKQPAVTKKAAAAKNVVEIVASKVAKETVVRKVAARKVPTAPIFKPTIAAAKPVLKPVVAKKAPVAAVQPAARKSPALPKVAAATKQPGRATKQPSLVTKERVRARRSVTGVLEVSPAIIDTTSAAEVAARLVVEGHGVPSQHGLGNIFTPPSAIAVKRGSSALRHVKERLNKPVAAQLDSVFGPAPVPPQTMRRFLKGQKPARTQGVRGSTNFHSGQSTVAHRAVG